MSIKKHPLVLAAGGFIVISAANSAFATVTGHYLFTGDSVSAEAQTGSSVMSDPWTSPIDKAMTDNYGEPGTLWASGHHTGVDFPAPVGTSVRSVAEGTVIAAGPGGKYGNQVVIRHGEKLYSQYAHLSKVQVSEGQNVKAGQEIALSGATGNVTGPHLHFEVRTGPGYGSDIDPTTVLKGTK